MKTKTADDVNEEIKLNEINKYIDVYYFTENLICKP